MGASGSAARDSRQAPLCILLVDDEPLVRRIVARMLRMDEYEVVEADAPEQALSMLADERIDLVLTDVMMPAMNGCELGRVISDRWPEMRVLYYSGHVFEQLFDSGICPRDIPFIRKPFDIERLRQRIEEIMETPPYRFPAGA